MIHIFASQGKIYTSLEFDETELKGSIATTETWALAMDFAPISSHGSARSAEQATRDEILQLVALEGDRKRH